ncbi:low molecular weight phosphotyrosine protein phosphatase 1 [Neodiprion lecontei]|uniref:Low molecular weight phosphotyrosine protein phosphatase n=1 Tax=Neodiprion lecontei TaxID=441921 RepID=A0A6J0CFZ6_NEOLC|nr:low molecular weight phosphotyrosine protein phosphatase 1 [Neodiprion lecontei]XP_046595892.1 low molecular weight phosphotyrosine protein phosphatase 1 [Neodiprion lecontei]
MSVKRKVLMICLGNICRSPLAEAVFLDFIRRKKLHDLWEVESAALIGYHTGKNPDHRAIATLKKHGITDYVHKARPINQSDYDKFDWIFGMDEDNIRELARLSPANSRAVIELLGKYDPEEELIIRDPYYDSDSEGFEKAYIQCVRSVAAFLEKHK